MIELKGKHNTAKVFTDVVDEASIAQVIELCNQAFCEGSRIRLMPDIHAGAGCTIGTTMTIKDKVVPNLVGVDIGCGMLTAEIMEDDIDLEKLDRVIHEKIPAGFNIHDDYKLWPETLGLESMRCAKHVNLDRAKKSIGTLGGGNHFIEADKDEQGRIYIVIHSGSRHLGVEVANYYQEAGFKELGTPDKKAVKEIIATLRSEGRKQEIQSVLEKMKQEQKEKTIPRQLAYVSGQLFEDYIYDMNIVQGYSEYNRQAMLGEIVRGMGITVTSRFQTIHNYIDMEQMILRKGAVSAKEGEKLLIPINMRDGSLICVGKGNEDWNYSAPHGAGRLMSRAAAKERFTVDEFRHEMDGIYTTSVGRATLDECPMAYKSMDGIVKNIGPTAEIVKIIKPIYNFKAGED